MKTKQIVCPDEYGMLNDSNWPIDSVILRLVLHLSADKLLILTTTTKISWTITYTFEPKNMANKFIFYKIKHWNKTNQKKTYTWTHIHKPTSNLRQHKNKKQTQKICVHAILILNINFNIFDRVKIKKKKKSKWANVHDEHLNQNYSNRSEWIIWRKCVYLSFICRIHHISKNLENIIYVSFKELNLIMMN